MNVQEEHGNVFHRQDFRKFLKRFGQKVQQSYLFTKNEIQQNLRLINLFKQFDTDGSGGLSANELAELFNDNGVMVDREQIGKLYGNKKVIFTLKSFEEMNKDKKALKRFKSEMKGVARI